MDTETRYEYEDKPGVIGVIVLIVRTATTVTCGILLASVALRVLGCG